MESASGPSEAFYAIIKTLLSNLKITRGHCREESSRFLSDMCLDFSSRTRVEPKENSCSVRLSCHISILQLEVCNTSLTPRTLVRIGIECVSAGRRWGCG